MKKPFSEIDLQNIFKVSAQNPNVVISRESGTLEFKEAFSVDVLNRCMKTIAGFANNEGGYIVFGIKDSPHELKGLDVKNEERFDSIDAARLTESLNTHFDPEIHIELRKYTHGQKCFGLMYVFPAITRPVICKKSEGSNLRESAIYYRYRGQSREVKYSELRNMIDVEREKVNAQWMRTVRQLGENGVARTALLDLNNGKMTGINTTLVVDENLLDKIKFVQEGSFVETGGNPALKVVGDVKTVVGAQTIVINGMRPRAITVDDIWVGFIAQDVVQSPEEYIKQICYQTTGNLPVYYYIAAAGLSIDEAIAFIDEVPKNSQAKTLLRRRLSQNEQLFYALSNISSNAGRQKSVYRNSILSQSLDIPSIISELKYCLDAFRSLTREEVIAHKEYILDRLYQIYSNYFNTNYTDIAQGFRYAVCWIDEALNMSINSLDGS